MLDTNIFGLIVVRSDGEIIHSLVHRNPEIFIYGCSVIRKELRDTTRVVPGINLRSDLLRAYDDLVKKTYDIESDVVQLANRYYEAYKNLGGRTPQHKLMNDLLIIACASLKQLDIVVSNDERTMLSESMICAYKLVNKTLSVRIPQFISYEAFKNELKK